MARKKRRHKVAVWRKWGRMIIGLIGVGAGAAVALSPAAKAYETAGFGPNLPAQLSTNYLGYNPNDGTFDPKKTAGGIGAVVGGILLIKLLRFVARSV